VTTRSAALTFTALLLAAAGACAQPAVLAGVRGLDHHGKPFEPYQLAGKAVLMHFVFTGCGSTCPTQVHELAAVYAALPPAARAKLVFLSVSVDPMADTPAALTKFAQRAGAFQPGWRFVTGQPKALAPLYERLQVFDPAAQAPGPDDHRTQLYLYAADGRLLQRFRGVPVDGKRLLAELSRL
jgi:cytochrome oxidase Cu insertion factor (SCO1/SenC/PrrC family)